MSARRPAIVLNIEEPLTEETASKIRGALGLSGVHWVLVKGDHDSSTIHGAYGPYSEAYVDWLLFTVLSGSTGSWTKIKLSSGPEES